MSTNIGSINIQDVNLQNTAVVSTNLIGGGAPPPFSPDDVAGLEVWLDASDATTINFGIDPAVSSITDKSGNSNTLSQGTAANQPTLLTASINGLDTLSFDGVNDILRNESLTNQPLSQPTTIYLVMAGHNDDTGANTMFDGADVNNRQSLVYNANGLLRLRAGGTDVSLVSYSGDGLAIYRAVYDGASTTVSKFGVTMKTGDAGPDPLVGFVVGGDYNNAGELEMELCEALVYDSEITGTDDTDILAYLNAKWASNSIDADDASLPDVQLWMKGDDGITIDTGVSSWIDQSDNAYDAVQAVTGLQPTVLSAELNGHDVIHFDGVDDELVITDPSEMTNKTEMTWFAVVRTEKITSPNTNQGIFASSTSEAVNSDFAGLFGGGKIDGRYQTTGAGNNSIDQNVMAIDTWYIMSSSFIIDIGGSTKKDNTHSDSTFDGVGVTLRTGHTGNFKIGDIWFSGFTWFGDIAEIVIFTTKLTATQEQGVYNGLKEKYAL